VEVKQPSFFNFFKDSAPEGEDMPEEDEEDEGGMHE